MASSHRDGLFALGFMASKSFWLLGGQEVSELCRAWVSAEEVITAFIILSITLQFLDGVKFAGMQDCTQS